MKNGIHVFSGDDSRTVRTEAHQFGKCFISGKKKGFFEYHSPTMHGALGDIALYLPFYSPMASFLY